MVKYKPLFVAPEFATFIKMKAVENNKTIVSYTKELVERSDKLKKEKINENFWRLL